MQQTARPRGNRRKSYSAPMDRLTTPMVRDRKGGALRETTWDEALDRAAAGFAAISREHGPDGLVP